MISAIFPGVDFTNKNQVFNAMKYLDDSYRSGNTLVNDATWDQLTDYYSRTFGEDYEDVVSRVRSLIPFQMGSPKNKIYDQHGLDLFSAKYQGPYLIADKIDGVTLVIDNQSGINRYFSKGGGTEDEVQGDILPINKNVPTGYAVRGELVLLKDRFKYVTDRLTLRDVPSAFVRTKNLTEKHLEEAKLLTFFAHKIYGNLTMDPKSMYENLAAQGFDTPAWSMVDTLDAEYLKRYLMHRKETAEYEMDGLIIIPMVDMGTPETNKVDFVTAFKLKQEGTLVRVNDVIWQKSSTLKLTPVIVYDPIKDNVRIDKDGNEKFMTLTRATAYNMRYVVDNGVGPGAMVRVARKGDVVPGIVSVESPGTIKYPDEDWEFNGTGVDAYSKVQDLESIAKGMVEFAKMVKNTKPFGITTAKKLMDKYGWTTIHQFIIAVLTRVNDPVIDTLQGVGENPRMFAAVGSKIFVPEFNRKKLLSDFSSVPGNSLEEKVNNYKAVKDKELFYQKYAMFETIYGEALKYRENNTPAPLSSRTPVTSLPPLVPAPLSSRTPLVPAPLVPAPLVPAPLSSRTPLTSLPPLVPAPLVPAPLSSRTPLVPAPLSSRTPLVLASPMRSPLGSASPMGSKLSPVIVNYTPANQSLIQLLATKRVMIATNEPFNYSLINNQVNEHPEIVIFSKNAPVNGYSDAIHIDVDYLK